VMHGHGAKGGAFVRLMPAPRAIRVYTPHGGSLHYGRNTLRGTVYGGLERVLMRRRPRSRSRPRCRRSCWPARCA
jgi:hypothetical protein